MASRQRAAEERPKVGGPGHHAERLRGSVIDRDQQQPIRVGMRFDHADLPNHDGLGVPLVPDPIDRAHFHSRQRELQGEFVGG